MTLELTREDQNHPLGPLQNPGRIGGLQDVYRRRYLLKLLVRKELRVRYQGSPLGVAWSYIKPGVRFVMYFWVIGLLISHKLPDRQLHIFSGMMMVHFFTEAMSSGSKSVVRNKSLVRKINLPREMFPVAAVAVSIYRLLPMYVLALFGCLLVGWHPDMWAFVAMTLAFVIILVYGLALALLLSAWNVYYRDVSNVVDVIQTIITWTVPMIYSFDLVKEKLRPSNHLLYDIYTANPLCNAVLLNNRALWPPVAGGNPHNAQLYLPTHLFERGFITLAAGLLFLWYAQQVFSRLEGRFAEHM